MTVSVIHRPSPNHDERPAAMVVRVLVLHYTGMQTAVAALSRLCDPAAKVSAHYTVDENGVIYAHVPEDRRAWHAGVSAWRGVEDVNSRSIGIEIVNPGHEFGYRPFPAVQMTAVETLCRSILRRHPDIQPADIVGHSDIACPRKQDPGELFEWSRLAAAGIGLWPWPEHRQPDVRPGSPSLALDLDLEILTEGLQRYGYAVDTWGLSACITAFHRHFRPDRLGHTADHVSLELLADLLQAAGR